MASFLVSVLLAGVASGSAAAYEPPQPGSPAALTDWRGLARPRAGERRVSNDPWGKGKLPPAEGGFLVLEAEGPGVLDHLWSCASAQARLTIEVDGKRLWRGAFGLLPRPEEKEPSLFPEPLLFDGGGMQHLVTPVGFQSRLRLIADKPSFHHFASYRVFAKGTAVLAADADPNGAYARGLAEAAELWRRHGWGIRASAGPPARVVEQPFLLPAKGRTVAFQQDGSGEITGLEFHVLPALTGTLRQVVVEITHDGAAAPSLRLPIPDLVGVPHPWPCGRWDRYNGDLAAGLRYPWYERTPRACFPEATFHLNLPIPFAKGLRVELVSRAAQTQFAGRARAIVEPLSEAEAARAGRLCGTRLVRPIRPALDPQPLIQLPGPGQLAGLSLFLTGNSRWPPAVHESVVALQADDAEPLLGHGILPLWFQGIYGGPILDRPTWNHPRLEEGYAGATRHFLTDPIPFQKRATFGYTPGPKAEGAPTNATVVALWYRFGGEPYAAPALPDQAEPLPHSVFGEGPMRLGPGDEPARLLWATEAEDLAPMAVAHQTEVRAVEDADHNYHPSGGRFLLLVAERPGAYVDFPVLLPDSRCLAVGLYPLWGPGRGTFDLEVLPRAQAKEPPRLAQGDAFSLGRMLGSVPMTAPIFSGDALDLRRDPDPHHTPPLLNPAPGQPGVLRIVCQAKAMTSNSFLLKLDRVRLDAPPPTKPGWLECEEAVVSRTTGGLSAAPARQGRFEWSSWGALLLESPPGGQAELTALRLAGPAKPTTLRLRGSLGPDQGAWQARVATGGQEPVALSPGKSAEEVVEWRLPAAGLALPGPIALELSCTAPGKPSPPSSATPPARLALDAWTAE